MNKNTGYISLAFVFRSKFQAFGFVPFIIVFFFLIIYHVSKTGAHVPDSSSLTNEKDHHYFLNSADVCW